MKKIFLLLFIVGSIQTLFAQNPDGHSISLHITPSWLWGDASYDRIAPVYIPPTQISDGYFANLRDPTGTVKYPTAFGLDVMMKVPLASFFTLSVSYSHMQRFEEINNPLTADQSIFYYWSLKGAMHKVSFTASFYNLFSLY
jgi:hypothetical protein